MSSAAQSVLTRALARLRARPARRGPGADEGLASFAALSRALLRASDAEGVARVLLDEAARLVDVSFALIALVSEDGTRADGLLGRARGADLAWVDGLEVDLVNEPSGIASAVFEGAPFAVFDTASSARVSPRLVAASGAKSAAYVPAVADGRVIAVIVAGETREKRDFTDGELALLSALAAESALALDRVRSSVALAAALAENERRIAQQAALLAAAQTLTSELRFEAVLERLVDEVVRLLGADAADCWLLDSTRRSLRCVAVYGLPATEIGRRIEPAGTVAEAMATGRPTITRTFQSEQPSESYREFVEVMDAPISTMGEIRGVFGVCSRESGRFDHGDLELLDAFASLVSLALQNAEAFEERSRQARIQQGFYRIASVLGEPLSLEATFDAVAHAAALALGGSSAALLMPLGERRRLVGAYRLPDRLRELLDAGEPGAALAAAADDRRVIASPALADDERFDLEWRTAALEGGAGSLLAVPVESHRSERAGLALVLCEGSRTFSDDDLELARHLAEATRGALERSFLFEAERTSRALAQQLARTGGLLATELDPEAVLEEVSDQARVLLGADACAISLLVDDELVISAVAGEGSETALSGRSSATSHLAGDVAQSRSPVAVETVSSDRRGPGADPLLLAGHESYLGVPLVGPEGALHGVLAVYSRAPRAWQEEEIDALLALAGNTSAALSNAELYQRVALEKERSFAILGNIADGIVAVDREGLVVLWNAAAEQITGVPAAEAIGRAPAQVLGRSLASDGEPEPGNRLVSIRRGAEEVWLSLSEAVMRDPAQQIAGRIYAFRDISADHLVEQMKSEFVSTVSHELRTPLTSIYGFAETLLRRDVLFDEDERRIFLGYIASESERLTGIVDTLLNVARLDAGDLQVDLAPTDVRPVLDEIVAGAQEQDGANGHRFVLDVPPEPLPAECDPDKVRQVLLNLVENAVRYSPGGGTVTVEARRASDTIEVRVVDEGIGIPHAEQERIWRKFYRAEAAAEGGAGGTGLGLFIARGLVTAMGGRIWVDSIEGEGSSFCFALPVARE